MTNQMIRVIRIKDHEAVPIDVSIDFSGEMGGGTEVMFFEIEQDAAIFLSLDGIRSVLAAAERLKAEFEGFGK